MICNGAPTLDPHTETLLQTWRTMYTWNLAMIYAGFVMWNLPTEILTPFNDMAR